jgi:hypothetical protein
MIIQTILLSPSGSDQIDAAPNVSRQDPTSAIQIDAKHLTRNRKVEGSNPSSGSTALFAGASRLFLGRHLGGGTTLRGSRAAADVPTLLGLSPSLLAVPSGRSARPMHNSWPLLAGHRMRAGGWHAGRMRAGRAVRIFLSYRRSDVGGHAGRLADALLQRLGARSVFQDVIAIAPGQDFTAELDRALDDSDAVLAVIGPGWLTAATPQGAPRLFEAEDYVRLELTRALNRNVRVVPVLVGGAALPAATDLPDELRGLSSGRQWSCTTKPGTRTSRGWCGRCVASRRCRPGRTAAGWSVRWRWRWSRRARWRGGGDRAPATHQTLARDPAATGRPVAARRQRARAGPRIALNDDPTGEEKGPGGSLLFSVKYARWRAQGEGTWLVTLATTMKNTRPDAIAQQAYYYGPLVVAQREFQATCFAPSPDVVDPQQVGDALVGFEVTCRPVGYIELVVQGHRIRVSKDPEPGAC